MSVKDLKAMSNEELLALYKQNKKKIQKLCREKEALQLKLNGGLI